MSKLDKEARLYLPFQALIENPKQGVRLTIVYYRVPEVYFSTNLIDTSYLANVNLRILK